MGKPLFSFTMDCPYVTSCSFLEGIKFVIGTSFDGYVNIYDTTSKD